VIFLDTADHHDPLANAVFVCAPPGAEADFVLTSAFERDARENGKNDTKIAIVSGDRDLFESTTGGPGKVFLRLVPGRRRVAVASEVFPRDEAAQDLYAAARAGAARQVALLEARHAAAGAALQQAKASCAAHRRAGPADAVTTQLQGTVDAAHKSFRIVSNELDAAKKTVRLASSCAGWALTEQEGLGPGRDGHGRARRARGTRPGKHGGRPWRHGAAILFCFEFFEVARVG
jgi:hypothetical protein